MDSPDCVLCNKTVEGVRHLIDYWIYPRWVVIDPGPEKWKYTRGLCGHCVLREWREAGKSFDMVEGRELPNAIWKQRRKIAQRERVEARILQVVCQKPEMDTYIPSMEKFPIHSTTVQLRGDMKQTDVAPHDDTYSDEEIPTVASRGSSSMSIDEDL